MKNVKHQQLTKTIQMYTHTHTANKARQPLLLKNFPKSRQSIENNLDYKSRILAEKYSELIQHLERYRKKIHIIIEQEIVKNQNHYLQMNKILENYRIESRNWLRQRAVETNTMIDEKMLSLQTKLYQITREQLKTTIQNQLQEYEQCKILNVPVFEVEDIDLKEFERDVQKYCIYACIQPQQEKTKSFSSLFKKKTNTSVASEPQTPTQQLIDHQSKGQTIKKQTKYRYATDDDDLICEEQMNWDEQQEKANNKQHYLFQDVIVEESSQEDSIIYNAQF